MIAGAILVPPAPFVHSLRMMTAAVQGIQNNQIIRHLTRRRKWQRASTSQKSGHGPKFRCHWGGFWKPKTPSNNIGFSYSQILIWQRTSNCTRFAVSMLAWPWWRRDVLATNNQIYRARYHKISGRRWFPIDQKPGFACISKNTQEKKFLKTSILMTNHMATFGQGCLNSWGHPL